MFTLGDPEVANVRPYFEDKDVAGKHENAGLFLYLERNMSRHG